MTRTLIKKELLENMLSFRFIITVLLCIVLIPLSIYVSSREYEQSIADYRQSQTLYHQSMQGMRNAVDVEVKGLRPPSPFSIFAGGLDKSLPDEIVSSRAEGLTYGNSRTMDAPLAALFGKMDFLFSVSVIMSLLAVLFTFDAATREKEEGTLRLCLSNPLPRHKLITAKYAGNFITFLIPFIAAMLISLIVLSLTGVIPVFENGNLLRLLLIIIVSLLFISAFFTLGLMVSALTKRSLTSQITLLFLWVLMVFAVPRVSGMAAGLVYPVKTRQTVNLEKSLIRKNIEDEKAQALKSAFQAHMSENPQDSQVSYDDVRSPIMEALRAREQRLLRAVDTEYLNRKRRQTAIASIFARLSPLGSLTFAVTELANTGLLQMDNLYSSSREFHAAAVREIHTKGYQDDIPGMGMRMSMGWINMESIPRFEYTATALEQALQAVWFDIILLVLFNVLFFSIAHVAFLRYDVR